MRQFLPLVNVVRESANYGIISFVVDGTIQVKIEDMCGYDFINDDEREQFVKEAEEFKSSLENAPDNFNDNDRETIRSFVTDLLNCYFEAGKLVQSTN